ncbi:hypothetical protein BKI52_13055 [marine bacterium AO1-C]|nr:hypothetical protein BKI52_13055 [marine bacterium AO1-C]
MKTLMITVLLIGAIHLSGVSQTKVAQMSTKDWEQDLTYLQKKIKRQFKTFIPGLKEKFDSGIEALKRKVPELKPYEISCEIMRLLALLKDGHTELNVGQKMVGFHRLPLSLYFFENELYIVAAHQKFAELIGGKITHIGKYTTREAFEKLKQNMSHDNPVEFVYAGPGYLVLTELLRYLGISDHTQKVTVQIERNGQTISRTFDGLDYNTYREGPWTNYFRQYQTQTPLYLSTQGAYYWHRYLAEKKTMYLNWVRINNQKRKPSIKRYIGKLFKEIDALRPNKLVIDLRLNNGGNYNLSRPLISAIRARKWLNQPGKIWVITGRRTFSAASMACVFLKNETKATVVGEPGRTHPNKSDNNEVMRLPNTDFLIEYTTRIKKHLPKHPDWDRIPVDVAIPPRFDDYKQGKDAALAYILDK